MKNQIFFKRLMASFRGIGYAWKSERSFRSQTTIVFFLLLFFIYFRPSILWFSLFILLIGATLAAELLNTALEYMIDFLHPEIHPQIGKAKDCAASAVLVLSFSSVIIFTLFIYENLK